MWWRLPHREWRAQRGEGNQRALKRIVKTGPPPGIVAYVANQPVGWCAVAPRSEFVRLATSRILQPVDAQPVWSVTCFFVVRGFRGQGVSAQLLKAAARFAADHGAQIVEGYPSEPKGRQADSFVYTGLASAFRQAGFTEVARRSPIRPIMRWMAAEWEETR
jgi:GNAT superfamily N-acetyltransferase